MPIYIFFTSQEKIWRRNNDYKRYQLLIVWQTDFASEILSLNFPQVFS